VYQLRPLSINNCVLRFLVIEYQLCHVAFLFSEDDEEFHNLIRKHMVMHFVLGDFYPGHSKEVAGGKYFALVKPNANGAPIPNAGEASVDADVRGIVIVSTWRRCSASRAVAQSSLAVADYLSGQYDNFLQLAGQKDGATRCAQIVQLLLENHVNHDVSDPLWLYSLMLPTLFALCPGNLSLMFWPVRHPVPTTMVGYRLPTNSLDRALYTNTGVIFCLCRAMPPLCVSVTLRGSLITCPAPRGGSRVMV